MALNLEKHGYLFPLLICTVLYLILESAFNATLLDATSGNVDTKMIEDLEFWGRILSGTALALFVLGTLIYPYIAKNSLNKALYLRSVLIIGVPIVMLVYFGQKMLVDYLVDTSTKEERRSALLLTLASQEIKKGKLLVDGISLTKEEIDSASGKAFLSVFSYTVHLLPHADEIVTSKLNDLIRQTVISEIGDVQSLYDDVFVAYAKGLQEEFVKYGNGVNEARKKYNKIVIDWKKGFEEKKQDSMEFAEAEADRSWSKYVKKLKKYGWTPSTVPSRRHAQVRSEVRSLGVYVPDNWALNDKKFFYNAVRQSVREKFMREVKKKEKEIKDKMKASIKVEGHAIPATLRTESSFLAHPSIQKLWREKINSPKNVKLHSKMTIQTFDKKIYQVWLNDGIKKITDDFVAKTETFADGQEREEIGKNAVRAMIVPPIALFFSLLGAIMHIGKTLCVSMGTVLLFVTTEKKSKNIARLVMICILVPLLTIPLTIKNPITKTDTYQYVENTINEKSKWSSFAMRWIIHTQTFYYPINEYLRQKIAPYIDFGVKVETKENIESSL